MAFGPVPAFELATLEERVLTRWREREVVEEVARLRKDAPPWIFYEGPPTANGQPGLHHVWARVFKDLYPRFQTMRGRLVPRKGGWDCHGLPVELEVEKELGISAKHEIEAYGIAEFVQRCRDSVQRYAEDWSSLTTRSGVWIDTKDAYWTLTNDYIESVWWLFRQMWDQGLIYEGHRVTPYCSRCGTALSSHEMGQPDVYRDVTDPSIYVRFPLRDRDADLLVWTTTPWTLLSNVAVAVGPEVEYVQVPDPSGGRDVVLAAPALERALGPGDHRVRARWSGRDLVGWTYQRPFTFVELDPAAGRSEVVIAADFVSTDDGSGLVHLAPAFGEDDAEAGRRENLAVVNPVGPDGAFDHQVPPWNGRFVKDADRDIIADLDDRSLLVREEPYLHAYPHCWRCGTPLIYWAKTSWFARTSERREPLLRENEKIGWHPEHIKHGRFGKWLETNVDWALSRDRYWGTPLPVWRCAAGHDTCVGSVEELADLAGRDLSDLDLHRPAVDAVTLTCPQAGCEATARRLLPVLDAWFDSGSMPSAQFHYPFEHREQFEASFPADFICEAIDQTRGWFYTLLAVNTLVFDSTPYRNVVCLNLIVDSEGLKMSKSRGNALDPWEIFTSQGADALRWYFFSAGQPWIPRRVTEQGVQEATRQSLVTLWNVYSFFCTYADIDGWTPTASGPGPATHVLDRWVRSELDDTIAVVTSALEGFDALAAATRLAQFVDDLSNWYVRRSRPRFWKATDPAAHATLHHCLVTTAELLAPFCPFLADEMWTTLTGGFSVHAADWPEPAGAGDPRIAEHMTAARRLVALGRSARTDAKVKVRQPLPRALLLHPGIELDPDVQREVADELNVKALEHVADLGGLISWTVVPNFRALGPRLGPRVNEVKAALAAADGSALKAALETDGYIEVAGERLGPDDLEVRADRHEAFALAQEGAWAVALDLEITDDLRSEGLARELVRALNELRKDAGLDLADRVRIRLWGPSTGRVLGALDGHREWIAGEVLAVELTVTSSDQAHPLEIDGEQLSVTIERAAPGA